MITEGEDAILLETTQRAFRNQSQSKQRSTLGTFFYLIPRGSFETTFPFYLIPMVFSKTTFDLEVLHISA